MPAALIKADFSFGNIANRNYSKLAGLGVK